MTTEERILYHQIHPLKLLTDASMAFLAVYLLWKRRLLPALFVSFVPSIVVSAFLVNRADLEAYKRSAFGKYLAKHMTHKVEALRLVGFVVMSLGGWFHKPSLIVASVIEILLCWLNGFILPVKK